MRSATCLPFYVYTYQEPILRYRPAARVGTDVDEQQLEDYGLSGEDIDILARTGAAEMADVWFEAVDDETTGDR